MGETTEQIAADIAQRRDELKSNLEELETRVRDAADWRSQFRRHPGVMIAAAMAGGMLLSSLLGNGSDRSSTRSFED